MDMSTPPVCTELPRNFSKFEVGVSRHATTWSFVACIEIIVDEESDSLGGGRGSSESSLFTRGFHAKEQNMPVVVALGVIFSVPVDIDASSDVGLASLLVSRRLSPGNCLEEP